MYRGFNCTALHTQCSINTRRGLNMRLPKLPKLRFDRTYKLKQGQLRYDRTYKLKQGQPFSFCPHPHQLALSSLFASARNYDKLRYNSPNGINNSTNLKV